MKIDPNKLTQGPGYQGEKLSLNFQNIEVRALLQVIADFTNFNVVTSDTVTGNVTLRLKDVPWDQALDIIMQSKGLGVRKSGNVLWIAPKDELAAKEQVDLEAKKKIAELEPLRTQSFQLNYTKAEDVAKGLTGQPGQGGRRQRCGGINQRASCRRVAACMFETRTNQLFVSDIPCKLEEVAGLIAKIDIPVRQVLIEARIVEADDSFGRALGVKLGASDLRGLRGGIPGYGVGGGNYVHRRRQLRRRGWRRPARCRRDRASADTQFVNLPANARHRRRHAGDVRAFAVQRGRQPLPEPGTVGAGGRGQGQDRVQPARHHGRPAEGRYRAGRRNPVPGGHVQRRHVDPVQEGQPAAGSDAADHARRQRDHGAGCQQGQPRR